MTDEIRMSFMIANKDNPSLTQKQLQEWVHSNYGLQAMGTMDVSANTNCELLSSFAISINRLMTFEISDEGGESTQELQELIKELGFYRNAMVVGDVLTHPSRQMELLGDETDIVPLYYHIFDNFQIQFGREEFCLVTRLRFGVEYWADYDNDDEPIPFRRRVFPSSLDGQHITGKTLVLLGVEDRRSVPDWMLRL
ncbi:hypothetical protein Tco_0033219, partial [Tanacetum coccineum]